MIQSGFGGLRSAKDVFTDHLPTCREELAQGLSASPSSPKEGGAIHKAGPLSESGLRLWKLSFSSKDSLLFTIYSYFGNLMLPGSSPVVLATALWASRKH